MPDPQQQDLAAVLGDQLDQHPEFRFRPGEPRPAWAARVRALDRSALPEPLRGAVEDLARLFGGDQDGGTNGKE
jgi:hypothetical protein